MKDLIQAREKAADRAWEKADLPEIADTGHWLPDGDFWSRAVYWENPDGGDSIFGSFGVEFKKGTAKVINLA